MNALLSALEGHELVARTGRVTQVRGSAIEAAGPSARIGEVCRIERAGRPLLAEVVGFGANRTLLMPYDELDGMAVGARIVASGDVAKVPVGEALLGRVVDAFGLPIDGLGPIAGAPRRALNAQPPGALQRARVGTVLPTGVKLIDGLLSLGKGQRIGLFAGSGVGKSSLLGMLARGTQAPVKVIALIGERAREVREFVEDQLGADGLRQAVVVVATASAPAVVRWRAAHAATTIAESLRDGGRDVLLMMDSLTRFAMARREVGLAAGEPPTARGYTPSVFSEIPQLCERCGTAGSGSITAIYTVLVEGDDLNEPISDTVRGTLDGHIVLSRELAHGGQYPAVDVLKSISRLHSSLAKPEDLAAGRTLLEALSVYERNRQLVEIGAYKAGANGPLDRAVAALPAMRAFLGQGLNERVERGETLRRLRQLAAQLGGIT
jgi:flagellum-specific ATP synthase